MKSEKRLSNFELLRIIAMVMIVAGHYCIHGIVHGEESVAFNVWGQAEFFKRFSSSMFMLGDVGVGVFFSITGYFCADKESIPNVRKVIEVTVFYSIISAITTVVIIILKSSALNRSIQDNVMMAIRLAFTPISSGFLWFSTAYLILCFCIPQINKGLSRLNRGVLHYYCMYLAI